MLPSSRGKISTLGSNGESHLIAVVTGGLRGLGKSLVSELSAQGFVVIRGQRSRSVPTANSQSLLNARDVELDLGDFHSVQEFSQHLFDEIPYIDLLINNAAICPVDPPDDTNAPYWHSVMQVNFFAPLYLTERLLPLLQRSSRYPRVINVSSGDGEFLFFSGELQKRLQRLSASPTAQQLSNEVKILVQELLHGSFGAPITGLVFDGQPAYKLSKATLNAYTRFAANRNVQSEAHEVSFLSVCPGDVDTDMADLDSAPIAPDEAVRRMLPILNVMKPCKTGVFIREGKEISW